MISRKLFRICIIGFVAHTQFVLGQAPLMTTSGGILAPKDSVRSVEKIDAFDVAADVLGLIFVRNKAKRPREFLVDDNDTIIKNIFSILPTLQYNPATSLSAGALLNTAFYSGKARNTNLSSIHTEAAYTLNHQFTFTIRSIIWSPQNKFNFVGDWRYDKYPSYTYGLGDNSSKTNKTLLDFSYIRFYQTVFKSIAPGFFIGAGYNLDYRFNITESGNTSPTDYDWYSVGMSSKSVSSGPTLNVLYDTRKNPNNPVKGANYLNVTYRYNSVALGSTNHWQAVIVDARKFIAFPANSSNILALWSYNWFSFDGKTPYLDLPSNYWDTYENQGRGYVQGRFRSHSLVSIEAEYRFSITSNKLFGGVIFTNAQSVPNWSTNTYGRVFPAAGMGLRIKINKFTNTNLAIDYAIGINGSQGVFFNLGEVF